MADQTYSGLTVGARFDSYSSRYVIGLEVGGGFVPFAQLSEAKMDKHLALSSPPPAPVAEPAPSMAPAEPQPAADTPAQ